MIDTMHTPGSFKLDEPVFSSGASAPEGTRIRRLSGNGKHITYFVGCTPELEELFRTAPETAAERDRLRDVNAELAAALKELLYRTDGKWPDGSFDNAVAKARAAIAKAEKELSR